MLKGLCENSSVDHKKNTFKTSTAVDSDGSSGLPLPAFALLQQKASAPESVHQS